RRVGAAAVSAGAAGAGDRRRLPAAARTPPGRRLAGKPPAPAAPLALPGLSRRLHPGALPSRGGPALASPDRGRGAGGGGRLGVSRAPRSPGSRPPRGLPPRLAALAAPFPGPRRPAAGGDGVLAAARAVPGRGGGGGGDPGRAPAAARTGEPADAAAAGDAGERSPLLPALEAREGPRAGSGLPHGRVRPRLPAQSGVALWAHGRADLQPHGP